MRCLRLFIALAVLVAGSPLRAEEPFLRFLARMREEGHFAAANHYLEQMRNSALIDKAQRELIDLELAKNHLAAAHRELDVRRAKQLLGDAELALQRFLDAQPNHPERAEVFRLLGLIQWEQAEILRRPVRLGRIPELSESDRKAAADFYQRARKALQDAHGLFRERLERALAQGEWDEEGREQKRLWHSQYVASRFAAARMLFELAELSGQDAARQYQEAHEEFRYVADKFRSRYLEGLQAILFQGRCQMALGDRKLALSYFEELLSMQGEAPAFRELQAQALVQAMQCWMDSSIGSLDRAIEQGERWLEANEGEESAELLAIRYFLARAYLQKNGTESPLPRDLRRRIAELVRPVARSDGPNRMQALQLLEQAGASPSADQADEFAAFEEAYEAASRTYEQAHGAQLTLSILKQRRAEASADEFEEFDRQIANIEKEMAEAQSLARKQFQQAVHLANQQTNADDLDAARYYLALLMYQDEDFLEAAVVASQVARKPSTATTVRYCAQLALAAWSRQLEKVGGPMRASVERRLADLAAEIIRRWPQSEEATGAIATQISLAAAGGEVARISELLDQIPRDAAQWARAHIQAGLATWNQMVKLGQRKDEANSNDALSEGAAGRSGEDAASDGQRATLAAGHGEPNAGASADLDPSEVAERRTELRARSLEWLTAGMEAVKDSPPDALVVQGALRLASLLLDEGRTAEALSWLDHESIGPRTLLRRGDPLMDQPGMSEAVHTIAIRAQVGYLAQATDRTKVMDQTAEMVQQLQRQLANTPGGRQRLLQVYLALARDLKGQLANTPPDQREPLLWGAEHFLKQAAQTAGNSQDVQVLTWVADTLLELDELRSSGSAATESVQQAMALYRQALASMGASGIDPGQQQALRIALQLRLAETLARARQFPQAMETVAVAIRLHPQAVNLQVQAAQLLERWGDAGSSGAYLQAIRGDQIDPKTGKPLIWGWARLASTVARFPQYRSMFYDARYHVARCRARYAKQTGDRDAWQHAKQDILLTFRLYPLPEDPSEREKFDTLLKEIQRELNEQPVGLAVLRR